MTIAQQDRIYSQYRTKPKAVQWFNITPTILADNIEAIETVRKMYDIDSNVGAQLDIIARIIGANRDFEAFVTFDTDDCGAPGVLCGANNIGFKNLAGNVNDNVNDELFRILIKAKIAKNNNDVTFDGILNSLTIIAPNSQPRIIDNEDYTFSIEFTGELTVNERFLLDNFDIIPKPQAVSFTGYTVVGTNDVQRGGLFDYGDTRAQYRSV